MESLSLNDGEEPTFETLQLQFGHDCRYKSSRLTAPHVVFHLLNRLRSHIQAVFLLDSTSDSTLAPQHKIADLHDIAQASGTSSQMLALNPSDRALHAHFT